MVNLVQKNKDGQVTTNSLLVAKKFNKEHKNIIRDIRNLLEDGSILSRHMFTESSYINEQSKEQLMYIMNRDGFTLLTMGFTGKQALNFKLDYIDAFNIMEKKLEEVSSLPINKDIYEAKTIVAEFIFRNLNLNEASKLLVAKSIADPLGLPMPEYAESKGVVKCASALLKEFGNPCSIQAFNQLMIDKGFMVELERKSKSSKTGKKIFKSLTSSASEYGENQTHPYNQRETQPMYYIDKFANLLSVLNLRLSA